MNWINTKEKLPALNQEVLVTDECGRVGISVFKEIEDIQDKTKILGWLCDITGSLVSTSGKEGLGCLKQTPFGSVTHWMFLPKGLIQKEKEE